MTMSATDQNQILNDGSVRLLHKGLRARAPRSATISDLARETPGRRRFLARTAVLMARTEAGAAALGPRFDAARMVDILGFNRPERRVARGV